MTDIAIAVNGLSKRYMIGHQSVDRERYTALRDVIGRETRNFFRRASDMFHGQEILQGDEVEEFWALKEASFEVKRGEALGIIGRNGSGKTTLLKILSRITEPTSGTVKLRGRVASLLEVGTGFHPELSGRENIYLNGAILGMARADIRRRFDEIVAYAEVEEFLDTPVKRYSSGMYVRLAFAVAAHLEIEILLVDEVLAVGDAEFQSKCLGTMNDLARTGRTVLFVSHNMGAVTTLTQRCLYLDKGRIAGSGPTQKVVEEYLIGSFKKESRASQDVAAYRQINSKESPARVRRIFITAMKRSSDGMPIMEIGAKFTVEVEIDISRSLRGVHFSIFLKNSKGEMAVMIVSLDTNKTFSFEPGRHIVSVHIEDLPLAPERYFAEVGVGRLNEPSYDVISDFPLVRVVNHGQVTFWPERPWGVLHSKEVSWVASAATAMQSNEEHHSVDATVPGQ